MTKFKILETKRKQTIQEDKVRTFQDALQNLASLGSAFGINTSLLTTVSGMAGNIVGLINAFKKSPKSRGLNKNDLLLADILKKDKKFATSAGEYIKSLFTASAPTSMPEEDSEPAKKTTTAGRTEEEEKLLLKDLTKNFASQGYGDKSETVAKQLMKNNPTFKTIEDFKK